MESMAQNLGLRLREIVQQESALLRNIPEEDSGARAGGGSGSRKEELGHLIDSATKPFVC